MKKNILIFGGTKGIGKEIERKLKTNYNTISFSRNAINSKNSFKIDLEKKEQIDKFLKSFKLKNIKVLFSRRDLEVRPLVLKFKLCKTLPKI